MILSIKSISAFTTVKQFCAAFVAVTVVTVLGFFLQNSFGTLVKLGMHAIQTLKWQNEINVWKSCYLFINIFFLCIFS